MWLSPQVYDVRTMPLDTALAFVLGVVLVASVSSLRRVLTPASLRVARAERAARSAFAELGIEKTRARSGMLVYVALFERTVVLVPDRGVPEALVAAFEPVRAALAESVRRTDFEAFLAALARLGPTCQPLLPRQSDDENELCDNVV